MRTLKHKQKKASPLRSIWQLRYRIYAIIAIIVIVPLLYASEKNIPENVAVEGLGYEVVEDNILASKIKRVGYAQALDLPAEGSDEGEVVFNEEGVRVYDKDGQIITEELKKAGIDLGFISSKAFVDLGSPVQVTDDQEEEFNKKLESGNVELIEERDVLDSILPPSQAAGPTNLLVYDKYKIRVPLIYTTLDDLFLKKDNGQYDFTTLRNTDDINSPVQKKLEQGIVHIAFSPQPGELGNSYIIGHSSNYSFVKSPYNKVFKPLESKSKPGEEFIIYDRYGRELKFKVFEALKIEDKDGRVAYQDYPDRRVVTLQTSILGIRNGRWEATHRWLTRGELVVD